MHVGFTQRFKYYTEHEVGYDYLVFTMSGDTLLYDYQVQMVANNPRDYIIPFEVRRKDDAVSLYYNITSKVSLADFLKTRKLSKQQFIDILHMLFAGVLQSKSLLLDEENFILSGEFIYIDVQQCTPCMVYLPIDLGQNTYWSIRDFILRLVTRVEVGDTFIKEIIESVNSQSFTVEGLISLLDKHRYDEVDEVLSDSSPIVDVHSKKMEITGIQLGGYSVKSIILAVVSQLTVVGLALGIEMLLKSQCVEEYIRYTVIGLLVLVIDFLLYKYFFSKSDVPVEKQEDKNFTEEVESEKSLPMWERKDERSTDNSRLCVEYKPQIEETVLLCVRPVAFLICQKDGTTERLGIDRDNFIIGRNNDIAHIVISHKTVGRLHAEIVFRNGGFYIIDKQSKNGTFVNGERLSEGDERSLVSGDVVMFGDVEYKFEV